MAHILPEALWQVPCRLMTKDVIDPVTWMPYEVVLSLSVSQVPRLCHITVGSSFPHLLLSCLGVYLSRVYEPVE